MLGGSMYWWMFFFEFGGWVFAFLALTIAVMAIRSVRRACVPTKAFRQAAACGQCSYSVEGLATMVCPECGTDLRRAGIASRGLYFRDRSRLAQGIAGLIVLQMIGSLISMVAGLWLFAEMAPDADVMVERVDLIPASGAYTVTLEETQDWTVLGTHQLRVTLINSEGQSQLHVIDVENWTLAVIVEGAGSAPYEVDRELIASWFASPLAPISGATPSEIQDLADVLPEISGELIEALPFTQFTVTNYQDLTDWKAPANALPYQLAGWGLALVVPLTLFVVMCLGIVLLVRKRKRELTRAFASPPAPASPTPS